MPRKDPLGRDYAPDEPPLETDMDRVASQARNAALAAADGWESFQDRVWPWMLHCFGEQIARDGAERNHRFLEEALELVQSTGCTATEAHQLVDYVFGRPTGEPHQEAGGVMVTLAALCLAHGLDLHRAGEDELTRVWGKAEKIRAKQAAKPKHGPLPGPSEPARNAALEEAAQINAAVDMEGGTLADATKTIRARKEQD